MARRDRNIQARNLLITWVEIYSVEKKRQAIKMNLKKDTGGNGSSGFALPAVWQKVEEQLQRKKEEGHLYISCWQCSLLYTGYFITKTNSKQNFGVRQ
jgi:hypothetical protein